MLTQRDLNEIERILDARLEDKLTEKLKGLPTRDEFYQKMDEVMGELKTLREEQTLTTYRNTEQDQQLENHEKRLKKLEVPATAAV